MLKRRIATLTLTTFGLLFAGPSFSARALPAGEVRCKTENKSGLVKKVITYHSGGKVYAINGQARGMAQTRGWVDGFEALKPDEMQRVLKEGLEKC